MRTSRAKKNLGDSGERVAALFLQERGYKIIETNFRTRGGEIDLVAEDQDGLAFVEVRVRRSNLAGMPEESLTPRKRTRMLAMAMEYLLRHEDWAERAWRVDFVGIELDGKGKVSRIELIKSAAEASSTA